MERASDPGWAWACYEPSDACPWTLPLAGHLYRRAAFGADWQQLQDALTAGPQATLDRLLKPFAEASSSHQDDALDSGGVESLAAWWLRRMLETEHPLQEKMTLFWHGRFGIGMARVRDPQLMAKHVRLLRTYALGSYRAMLQAAVHDPAMYVGLNAEANRKAVPNPNLTRHLLSELGVGPGYDEHDALEAARAFTGWFVLQGQLKFFDREHDTGSKTVLDQQGAWKPEDIVRIVLDRAKSAEYVVRDLWNWLISETQPPEHALIEPLVGPFAESYDIGWLVETMLRSNIFFSPIAYRQRVKSPVEYALGIARGIGRVVPTLPLAADLAALGQALYNPPTNKGWAGGRHWLNAATVVGRERLAKALLQADGRYAGKLNPSELVARCRCQTVEEAQKLLIDVFLQEDLSAEARQGLAAAAPRQPSAPTGEWLRSYATAVVTLPEFHLS